MCLLVLFISLIWPKFLLLLQCVKVWEVICEGQGQYVFLAITQELWQNLLQIPNRIKWSHAQHFVCLSVVFYVLKKKTFVANFKWQPEEQKKGWHLKKSSHYSNQRSQTWLEFGRFPLQGHFLLHLQTAFSVFAIFRSLHESLLWPCVLVISTIAH